MSSLQAFFNEHRPKSTPNIFSLVLNRVETVPNGIALDLCCGSGQLTAKLAERGYRAYGVDISDHFIGQGGGEASGFVVADVTAVPFATGSAQLVCSIDSLQLVPDPGATIAEIARLLPSGGNLILSTQNNYNPVGIKKRLMEKVTGKPWSPWLSHPIENWITYPWLEQTLKSNGFEIQYLRGQQFMTMWVGLLPAQVRNWSPWRNKPWRSAASIAQRTRLPRAVEESALARYAMIVLIHAKKL